jgi:hypothetical protein
MPKILIVEKGGEIKELNLKSYSEEELFKKAGFKSSDGFEFQTQWEVEMNKQKKTVSLYAKTKGRAGQENKYDFPPPVDNKLYFGACVLVNTVDGKVAGDLTAGEWEKIYESLFGGFENLGSEDSELSTDGEEYANVPRTKEGYVKDDFVVDSSDEEIAYEKPMKVLTSNTKTKVQRKKDPSNTKPKKSRASKKSQVETLKEKEEKEKNNDKEETDTEVETDCDEKELEYTKELEEEEYV